MAWTATDIPDLGGQLAVVTGANSGLGLATARELARRGAHVVMAVRDIAKAEAARDAIVDSVPDARLELAPLDLADLGSVRATAERITNDHSHVDILVNNAGIMAVPEGTTAEGFEKQLGTNHLGHFVLTRRLLPALLSAPAGRIVTVSSFGRFFGMGLRHGDLHRRGWRYGPWRAYNRSKLANFLFGLELQRRLDDAGATATSLVAHPGLTNTDLQARAVRENEGGILQRFWHLAARTAGMTPEDGALPQLRAATEPNPQAGRMYAPRWLTAGSPVVRSLHRAPWRVRTGERLWEISERAAGEPFDVTALVHEST